MPFILLEFSVLSYLRDRLVYLQQIGKDSLNRSKSVSSILSLHAIAASRSARALCIFLRYTRVSSDAHIPNSSAHSPGPTRQNREGMYLLVGSAGHQFSVLRLQHLANTLFSADVDDWDLFPLGLADKLASVTL